MPLPERARSSAQALLWLAREHEIDGWHDLRNASFAISTMLRNRRDPITRLAVRQDSNPAIDNFHTFFAPFLGSEWVYHTHMTNADGSTLFEGEDIRTYALGIQKRYVIESAFSEGEYGQRTHVGTTLLGVNVETGNINVSAFWPWQSTALGTIEAEIEVEENGNSRLQGIGRPAGHDFPVVRVNCEFKGTDTFHCVTHTTTEDGNTYKSNEERFTRRLDMR